MASVTPEFSFEAKTDRPGRRSIPSIGPASWLDALIRRWVRVGNLRVRYANGRVGVYGDATGPAVTVALTPRGERRLPINPDLNLGEAYMDGDLVVTEGAFWDLVAILGRNWPAPGREGLMVRGLHALQRRLRQANHRAAARRNVHHHYDLSVDFYRRFLDEDLQYSCAYFARPDMTLEEAQAAKKAHLAAKLALKPGQSVLDIGCGWGGLGLELASRAQAHVTGVTLSMEQLALARKRAQEAGLAEQARFELMDYRDVAGPFNRIVSVGMLEHVGAPYLAAYFEQVRRLLKDDGVAVIHCIASRDPPGVTQPFIQKYIFPGGYIPGLGEVTAAVEASHMWITDIEILRLHYAETLRCWRERFLARRAEMVALYDERFCRMWEVYLCFSELAFRYLNCMVIQVQLTKQVDVLPITRDYMLEAERSAAVGK
jgi:cyclopropane-fatty-acyl-phospholipid synthase